MSYKIVAVRKDGQGNVRKVKLDDGREISVLEAVHLADEGELPGYHSSVSYTGTSYLRSDRDRSSENNLDNLPRF